jgi:hypothetical protein
MRLYLSDALCDMDLSGSRHARKRKHQHRELGRVGSGGRRVFTFFGSSPSELLVHTLVSLSFKSVGMYRLTGSDKRKEYLRAKLHIWCVVSPNFPLSMFDLR